LESRSLVRKSLRIARKFETTVAKLRDLNPALRADRVPPNERIYSIRVPSDDGDSY